ncbi:KaiC domain-containing protein [Halobacteriales archaeon QS_6_71_20]|nr:MAG: KaiC domain-containing protein [Halobacteriales archaeon QS_6_71_20]
MLTARLRSHDERPTAVPAGRRGRRARVPGADRPAAVRGRSRGCPTVSDGDEDWFERALRETDESDDRAEDGTDGAAADGEADADAGTDDVTDPEGSDAAAPEGNGSPDSGDSAESAPDGSDDPSGTDDDSSGGNDAFGGDDDLFGGDAVGGTDAFGDAEADGFGGLDATDGSDGATEPISGDDPLGGGAGSSEDPFGGGASDGESFGEADDDPFGDDFGAAMQSAPEDDPFGGGGGEGFGGGGGPEFDEAEFESDIDRIDIGIEGLDEMVLGGVPERSLMAVIGSAGTGKTTFGLQFLNEALEDGGDAVYVTLEESREAILSTAEEKGWEFRRFDEEDRLAVVAMDPIEMANSLDSIRGDISRLVTEFDADRLVLDSVSLLEMMYDRPSKRRSEVFDFARSLKGAGVTTMLTSEASEENPFASRHGIVEYLTDAVFVLQYVRPSDLRETRLAVEIQKIRDANHSRETKPYEITDEGISVYRQANIF